MSSAPEAEAVPQQRLQVLLQQYRECSAHHVCMYREFARTLEEAESGEFASTGGLRLYRLDFFVILRTLMYVLIVLLASLSGLALADLLGAEIFD